MSVPDFDYCWVDNAQELEQLCLRWQAQGAIALDTEFVRTDTFYPKPGLIQLADGKDIYLIDPVAVPNHPGFTALLTNPAVTKVLHSCSEDLEVFRVSFGCVPTPVFDTQLAAAFCDYGFSVGYANLVKAMLNLELPKDATRSNWLQRPLAEVQKRYASLDVAHLLVVYGKLLQQLRAEERLDWVLEDCRVLVEQATDTFAINPDYYQKLKLAWKLDRKSLAVLKAVCQWREAVAREQDQPRNRIVKDAVISEIAERKPPHLAKLSTLDGIGGRFIRQYGNALVEVIHQALNAPEEQWPERLPKPLPASTNSLGKALKARLQELSEQLQLPTEVLARKADLNTLVRSVHEQSEPLLSERLSQGWRFERVGRPLAAAAQAFC